MKHWKEYINILFAYWSVKCENHSLDAKENIRQYISKPQQFAAK